MGIVDYAASSVLAISGAALAAPFIEAKMPAAAPFSQSIRQHRKLWAIFGMAGGALGILLIPVILLLVVGFGNLFDSIPVLLIAFLELIGCAMAVGVGFMLFRVRDEAPPHDGQLDLATMAGLGGVAYGGALFLLITVVGIIF